MTEYDNTNRGVLFKNDRKTNSQHPDYKGSIDVNGTSYWLSAWIKEGQKGKFMSLSIQPKEEQKPAPQKSAPKKPDPISTGRYSEMDDEIPF